MTAEVLLQDLPAVSSVSVCLTMVVCVCLNAIIHIYFLIFFFDLIKSHVSCPISPNLAVQFCLLVVHYQVNKRQLFPCSVLIAEHTAFVVFYVCLPYSTILLTMKLRT